LEKELNLCGRLVIYGHVGYVYGTLITMCCRSFMQIAEVMISSVYPHLSYQPQNSRTNISRLRMKSMHNVSCHTCAKETRSSISIDVESL